MYFFHCFTELVQTQNLYKYHLRYKSILYHHSIVISFKNLKNQWISVNIPVFVPFLGLFFLYLFVLFYSDMGFVCLFDWLIYWICCCLILSYYISLLPLKILGFFSNDRQNRGKIQMEGGWKGTGGKNGRKNGSHNTLHKKF